MNSSNWWCEYFSFMPCGRCVVVWKILCIQNPVSFVMLPRGKEKLYTQREKLSFIAHIRE